MLKFQIPLFTKFVQVRKLISLIYQVKIHWDKLRSIMVLVKFCWSFKVRKCATLMNLEFEIIIKQFEIEKNASGLKILKIYLIKMIQILGCLVTWICCGFGVPQFFEVQFIRATKIDKNEQQSEEFSWNIHQKYRGIPFKTDLRTYEQVLNLILVWSF